jgi:hypothetical protein
MGVVQMKSVSSVATECMQDSPEHINLLQDINSMPGSNLYIIIPLFKLFLYFNHMWKADNSLPFYFIFILFQLG